MKTKIDPSMKVAPVASVRLLPADQEALKFIQEKLSVPGMQVNFTDAVRRSIHAYANELRAVQADRRKEEA